MNVYDVLSKAASEYSIPKLDWARYEDMAKICENAIAYSRMTDSEKMAMAVERTAIRSMKDHLSSELWAAGVGTPDKFVDTVFDRLYNSKMISLKLCFDFTVQLIEHTR